MKRNEDQKKQSGAVLIMLAVFIFLLLGFIAAGVEGGRWYLVRAELAKSVDAGALIAARNVSNPNVNPTTLALEYANANFPAGSIGTPTSGGGSAAFSVTWLAANKVQVNGGASATSIFAQILGFGLVPVHSLSVAIARPVEIIMTLDRSGSMGGSPMTNLKSAATKFVDFFAVTQALDKMGLISFSHYAKFDRAIATNFVGPIKTAINNMQANNHTNAEDAIDQADGVGGFTNQVGVAPQDRIAQFMIFFSDGQPNCVRGSFNKGGTMYDAIVQPDGDCPGNGTLGDKLYSPTTGAQINVNPIPTGDGLAAGSACGNNTSTRWMLMDAYPVAGSAAPNCNIPETTTMKSYVCGLAESLALLHAKELKDAGVTIYTIGLGDVDADFMKAVASGPGYCYLTFNDSDLEGIFQHIALEIKLRLVQ